MRSGAGRGQLIAAFHPWQRWSQQGKQSMPPPRLLLVLLFTLPATAASPQSETVRSWRVAHERELITEYLEFLAIPNVTVDRSNIRRNADYVVEMMKRRGIDARLLTVASG